VDVDDYVIAMLAAS